MDSLKHIALAQAQSKDQKEQNVWICCASQAEQDDIFMLCKKSRQSLLIPKIVEPDVDQCDRWHQLMLLRKVPKQYASRQDARFRIDVDAWLSATFEESLLCEKQTEDIKGRWPSVLVTDSVPLVKASFDVELRTAVARALSLELNQLLPVVLSADFGRLSGLVIMEAPVPLYDPVSTLQVSPVEDADFDTIAMPEARDVYVADGIYVQRANDDASWPKAFGTRCVALFSDGRCAYAAISPDGARSIESAGTWEVVNGYVVLVGPAHHMRLSDAGEVLGVEVYEEPVFLSLEELESDFEPSKTVAECMQSDPDIFGTLPIRNDLSAISKSSVSVTIPPSDVQITPRPFPTVTSPSSWAKRHLPEVKLWDVSKALPTRPASVASATPTRPQSSLEGGTWSQLSMGRPLSPSASPMPSRSTTALGKPVWLSSTGAHLGHSMAKMSKSSQVRQSPIMTGSSPRMLGGLRSINFSRCTALDPTTAAGLDNPAAAQAQRLLHDYASKVKPFSEPVAFLTCPLRPGTYSWEQGQPDKMDFLTVHVVLHAGGGCSYREESSLSIVDTVPDAASSTSWSVHGEDVILSTCETGAYCFWHREAHGTRFRKRKVASVKLPLQFLRKTCSYEPFQQTVDPFQGYMETNDDEKALGLIDHDSPVLNGIDLNPTMIAFSDFERELRNQGADCDEMISDFRFIDGNRDGMVHREELLLIEEAAKPGLCLELLQELHAAFLLRFHTLDRAFEEMAALASASKGVCVTFVTLSEFKEFLAGAATMESQHPDMKPLGDGGPLESWIGNMADDSIPEKLFHTLNGRRHATLDSSDFNCLSLHVGLLSICRLDYFQSWLFSSLGQSTESFRKLFPVDKKKAKKKGKGKHTNDDDPTIAREDFQGCVQEQGFTSSDAAFMSIFNLMDRNFDGELSLAEMSKFMTHFSYDGVVSSFVALKKFVQDKFGGTDECFKRFVAAEKAATGRISKNVSYESCRKVLDEAGLSEVLPDADITMLFLFLDESTDKPPDGYLNYNEWALLKGFEASALDGSAARLAKFLQETFGSVEEAYNHIQNACLRRTLAKSMRQTGMRCLARAFACGATGPVPVGSVPIQPTQGPNWAGTAGLGEKRQLALTNPGKLDISREINPHSRYFVSSACAAA